MIETNERLKFFTILHGNKKMIGEKGKFFTYTHLQGFRILAQGHPNHEKGVCR